MEGLDRNERTQLHALLEELADVIASGSAQLGRTTLVRHTVDTGEAVPVRLPPRRLPFHRREEGRQMLDKMGSQGVIEPAIGPWASPIVSVSKKDGQPDSVWTSGE